LIKPIASRGVFAVVPATMVLALAALIHCGSDSSNGDVIPAGDDGGGEGAAFGEGGAGDTGVTCKAVGATCAQGTECCVGACTSGLCGGNVGDAGAKACNMADAVCAKGFDCCSGTCNGGHCVGNTLVSGGGDGGAGSAVACIGPTTACTTGNQCCSGLCEPVTGMAGVIQCRDACRADGVACVDAQDCCTLACNGGVCGGTICRVESETCTVNSDCCSNLCDPATKKCLIDAANSTCRPTGETCNSGPQKGCCGATAANDLCDKSTNPPRCIAPPSLCKGDKATCVADADCCNKHCDPASHTCGVAACVPAAGPCMTGADCCTSSCTNGSCDAPLPPPPPPTGGNPPPPTPPGACLPVGSGCASAADCCTSLCLGGFCDIPGPR
jgi:hypothetical protein